MLVISEGLLEMICYETPLLKEWKGFRCCFRSHKIYCCAGYEYAQKLHHKSEFSLENSKENSGRAKFRSTNCVNYNNGHCENSRISSNYAPITFAEYCAKLYDFRQKKADYVISTLQFCVRVKPRCTVSLVSPYLHNL